jgi:hypothetical protein
MTYLNRSLVCLLIILLPAFADGQTNYRSQRPIPMPDNRGGDIDQQFRLMQQLQRLVGQQADSNRGQGDPQQGTQNNLSSSLSDLLGGDSSGAGSRDTAGAQQMIDQLTKDLSPEQREALGDVVRQFQRENPDLQAVPPKAELQQMLEKFVRDRQLPQFDPERGNLVIPNRSMGEGQQRPNDDPDNRDRDTTNPKNRDATSPSAGAPTSGAGDRSSAGDRSGGGNRNGENNLDRPRRDGTPLSTGGSLGAAGSSNGNRGDDSRVPRPVGRGAARSGASAPDPANPDPANPDPANPDPANPDPVNPANPDAAQRPGDSARQRDLDRTATNSPGASNPGASNSGALRPRADAADSERSAARLENPFLGPPDEAERDPFGPDPFGVENQAGSAPAIDSSRDGGGQQKLAVQDLIQQLRDDPGQLPPLEPPPHLREQIAAGQRARREAIERQNQAVRNGSGGSQSSGNTTSNDNGIDPEQLRRIREKLRQGGFGEALQEIVRETRKEAMDDARRQAQLKAAQEAEAASQREKAQRAASVTVPPSIGGLVDADMVESMLGNQQELERMVKQLREQIEKRNAMREPGATPAAVGSPAENDRPPRIPRRGSPANRNAAVPAPGATGKSLLESSRSLTQKFSQWYREIRDGTVVPSAIDSSSSPPPTAILSDTAIGPIRVSSMSVVLVMIGLVVLAAAVLGRRKRIEVGTLERASYARRIPGAVANRDDVINAFHCIAMASRAAPQRWWPHPRTAHVLAQTIPAARPAVEQLAQLYEFARYSPQGHELSPDQILLANQAVHQLRTL